MEIQSLACMDLSLKILTVTEHVFHRMFYHLSIYVWKDRILVVILLFHHIVEIERN